MSETTKVDVDELRRGVEAVTGIPDALIREAALLARLEKAEAENARLREALRPFAAVAEHDIGESESDADRFRPMRTHNRAPLITVGDLRRARALTANHPVQGD